MFHCNTYDVRDGTSLFKTALNTETKVVFKMGSPLSPLVIGSKSGLEILVSFYDHPKDKAKVVLKERSFADHPKDKAKVILKEGSFEDHLKTKRKWS